MIKKNVGRLDRNLRFVFAAILVLVGLGPLGGSRGNTPGILVAGFALLPLTTGLLRICPAYNLFGINTLGGDEK